MKPLQRAPRRANHPLPPGPRLEQVLRQLLHGEARALRPQLPVPVEDAEDVLVRVSGKVGVRAQRVLVAEPVAFFSIHAPRRTHACKQPAFYVTKTLSLSRRVFRRHEPP